MHNLKLPVLPTRHNTHTLFGFATTSGDRLATLKTYSAINIGIIFYTLVLHSKNPIQEGECNTLAKKIHEPP